MSNKYTLTASYLFTALFIIAAIVTQLNTYIASDLGWHIYLAEQMLNGKKLYQDFFEVNFPMIIYLTLIPAWLNKITGFSSIDLLNGFNFFLAFISLLFSWLVIKNHLDDLQKLFMLPILAFILFIAPMVFPASEFGQKEHVFIIFTLPYFLSVLGEDKGWHRFFIALMAGIGFAIKPFFLLYFAAVEIFRIINKKPFFRLELLVIILTQLAYYYVFWMLDGMNYISITEIASHTYPFLYPYNTVTDYLYYIYAVTLFSAAYYLVPALLGSFILPKKFKSYLIMLVMLALTVVALQFKGFWYHYIPLISFSLVIFALVLPEVIKTHHNKLWLKVPVAVFMFFTLLQPFDEQLPQIYNNKSATKHAYQEVIEELRPYKGKMVYVISPSIASAFPIVNYLDLQWPAMQHSQQILDGVFSAKYKWKKPHDGGAGMFVVYDAITTLEQGPEIVLVKLKALSDLDKWSTAFFFKNGQEYIDYFSRYPSFKDQWQKYEYIKEIGNQNIKYAVYKLVGKHDINPIR